MSRLIWQPVSRLKHGLVSPRLRALLADTDSLTRHLSRYCSEGPGLMIRQQSWQRPLRDEVLYLDLSSGGYAFVREISLTCQGSHWVYGRSILPVETVSGSERRLLNWGTKSLGDYLFTRQHSIRGPIEIARIPVGHALHDLATVKPLRQDLWGRRSTFYVKGKPLLVIEILLPDLYRQLG